MEGGGYQSTQSDEDRLTGSKADSTGDGTPADDGDGGAHGVAGDGADGDPPVVLAGGHGDGRDLASVAPLAEEGHDEGLDPGRAEQEREQVVEPGDRVPDRVGDVGRRRRSRRRRRARRRQRRAARRRRQPRVRPRLARTAAAQARLERERRGRRASVSTVSTRLVLALLHLHLDLLHLFARVLVRAHLVRLPQHLEAEDEKQRGGEEVGEPLRDQRRHGVAEHGREHRHGDQRGESGGEDQQSRVLHRHERRHQEGLVADLREQDHRHGQDQRMQRLDQSVRLRSES